MIQTKKSWVGEDKAKTICPTGESEQNKNNFKGTNKAIRAKPNSKRKEILFQTIISPRNLSNLESLFPGIELDKLHPGQNLIHHPDALVARGKALLLKNANCMDTSNRNVIQHPVCVNEANISNKHQYKTGCSSKQIGQTTHLYLGHLPRDEDSERQRADHQSNT